MIYAECLLEKYLDRVQYEGVIGFACISLLGALFDVEGYVYICRAEYNIIKRAVVSLP